MAYEIEGKIVVKSDEQTFGSGFSKREFVIETQGKYPQQVPLELVKDRCKLLDKFELGEFVTVTFDVRGREYNGRFFVNLNAWKISGEASADMAQEKANDTGGTPDDDENIPF